MMDNRRKELPPATAAVMQNLVDSHDTDRMASMIVNGEGTVYPTEDIVYNKNNDLRYSPSYKIRQPNERERNIQRLIVLLQMSYIGAPMIYYGDEAGMWGAGDPDDRMPMIWPDRQYDPETSDPRGLQRQPDEVKFDDDLFKYYKDTIALRRQHDALNHGDFAVVVADDEHRMLLMSRHSDKETLFIALNRSDQEGKVNVEGGGKHLAPIFVTRGDLDAVKAELSETGIAITLPPMTGAVFATE
jgi:glycosidase